MNEKGFKRKRKSFFQQSVKYHKKGIHGKGARIDDESYEYFLNVLKIMNQEFESDDDKKIFVENVFNQLEGKEVNCSCNQLVSRVIENLLPFVSEEVLSKLMKIFQEEIRIICMDQFASFVMQKLIMTVCERYLKIFKEDADNNEENEKFIWLTSTSRFVLNNLEEFAFDNYPNRVMRTVICCLIGYTKSLTDDKEIITNENIPKEFKKILKEFSDHLLNWSEFKQLPYNTVSSGFLQVLIRCLASLYPKRVKKIGLKLVSECFISEAQTTAQESGSKGIAVHNFSNMIPVFQEESSTRLLEVVISIAPPELFTQIYSNCFFNRLAELACHSIANFSVQKLIRFCTEKTEFEAIFDELALLFENIMENGRSGVILELSTGCVKHKTRQSNFMSSWMKYLECDNPKDIQSLVAPLTIYMKKRSQYNCDEKYHIQLHGSLLIQNGLKFNKPIKLISSLQQMKPEELCTLFCDPKGSHIANAYFESEFVGEKNREKLFKILQGSYSSLAVSKHGSRIFDLIWKWCSVKNKSSIVAELLEHEAKLNNSQFGRPIIYNVSMGAFRRNKEDWIKAQSSNDKVKKLFQNIVE